MDFYLLFDEVENFLFKSCIMDTMVGMMRGLGYSLTPMFVTMIGVVGVRLTWLFTVFPLLCVIPPAIFAYVGYYRSHREEYKVNLVEYVAVPTYVSDRRYKDGRRYAGDILQKRVTKTAAFPEEEEVLIARAKWWYYLAGGILACAVFSGIYLMNHPEMMK